MKKLVKSVLMLSIASLAILSSCKKDDSNADVTNVKVDITTTPASPVPEGSRIVLTVTSTGNTDNKLKSISVTRSQGSDQKVVLSKSLTGTTSTDTIPDTLVSGTYTYTVAVTGEKGSPATKTITVVTVAPAGALDVTANGVPLFGQTNGGGTNQNFMKLTSQFNNYNTTEFNANKSSIDLAYYFGNTNKATITSPTDNTMQGLYSGLSWTGVNTTALYKTTLTSAQYDAIVTSNSDAQITALAATVTTWVSSVNLLTTGNVILFKTAGNKLGLIKVENLTGTTANDSQIDLSVAVQD